MKEEVYITFKCFTVIYGLILYIVDNNPSSKNIDEIFKEQKSIKCTESDLVNKYINKDVTERLNANFFKATGLIESAEEKIIGAGGKVIK